MNDKVLTLFSDWNFLPECLRSLEPMDRVISRYLYIYRAVKGGGVVNRGSFTIFSKGGGRYN